LAAQFSDLCILAPDYQFLLRLVRSGQIAFVDLGILESFPAKMLERKGLAKFRNGVLWPTALGNAAARVPAAGLESGVIFLTAGELAAAAAL